MDCAVRPQAEGLPSSPTKFQSELHSERLAARELIQATRDFHRDGSFLAGSFATLFPLATVAFHFNKTAGLGLAFAGTGAAIKSTFDTENDRDKILQSASTLQDAKYADLVKASNAVGNSAYPLYYVPPLGVVGYAASDLIGLPKSLIVPTLTAVLVYQHWHERNANKTFEAAVDRLQAAEAAEAAKAKPRMIEHPEEIRQKPLNTSENTQLPAIPSPFRLNEHKKSWGI